MLPPGRQARTEFNLGPEGFAQTMWFTLTICFPSRSLEFRRCEAEGTLHDQPSINTLGAEPNWMSLG